MSMQETREKIEAILKSIHEREIGHPLNYESEAIHIITLVRTHG